MGAGARKTRTCLRKEKEKGGEWSLLKSMKLLNVQTPFIGTSKGRPSHGGCPAMRGNVYTSYGSRCIHREMSTHWENV